MDFMDLPGLLTAALVSAHVISILLAAIRFQRWQKRPVALKQTPGVTLARPLRGVDGHTAATLTAGMRLTYPKYEVLFCVADAGDPVVPLVRDLIRAHPDVDARLLIGNDHIGANPKLNNMVKAWREGKYEFICFTDSNLLVRPDYLDQLVALWDPTVGAVSSPPVASDATDFWGDVECAFLNGFAARWQYAADMLGLGFCQGKTLFFHRSLLAERGIAALADEPAEDAALTRVARSKGLSVQLVAPPYAQPVGSRNIGDIWSRQVRWARLRRATFPFFYGPEIFLGILPAALAVSAAAHMHGWSIPLTLAIMTTCWYGAELLMGLVAGWALSWRSLGALVARDLMLPALWVAAWAGDSFTWHGVELDVEKTPWKI